MVSDVTDDFPDKFEPGCCDVATGIAIENSIYEAYDKVPVRSKLAKELWMRYEMVDQGVADMEKNGDGLETWWDKIPQWINGHSNLPLSQNLTLGQGGNASRPRTFSA